MKTVMWEQVKDANADNPRTHWGLVACKDCGDSATRERQRERSSCKRAILGRVEHVEEKADAEEKEEVRISRRSINMNACPLSRLLHRRVDNEVSQRQAPQANESQGLGR